MPSADALPPGANISGAVRRRCRYGIIVAMKTTLTAFAFALASSASAAVDNTRWNVETYEPRTPAITGFVASGFHGSVAPMKRIDMRAVNALTDANRSWKGVAWRNERINAQFVLWTRESAEQVRVRISDFVSADGARIPASACRSRFVRYVLSSQTDLNGRVIHSETLVGDCLDTAERVDMPENGFRPFWFTMDVPADAKPGEYCGTVTAIAQGGRKIDFGVAVEVQNRTLPCPKDWRFFLDLWQHPLAVARYHGVKPWSKDHFAMLKPLLGELASIGQKTITATLTDHPWNHQNFDAYRTMVEHVKGTDGKFSHDYSIFDKWVEFALSCGLGPQIHCYTMVTWGNLVHYVDGATGDKVAVKLVPGTPEHEAFWGPFLVDFEKHLKAKGWLGRTYIAIDERSREELMASAAVLNKYAPALKIQMAGNKPPSTFKGIEIHNYSQSMRTNWVSPDFRNEVEARREKGYVTTTYICCNPARPNTFTFSPYSEQQWLALYTAAQGFDGMLRWAVFNWPRDPFSDTAFNPHFGSWAPGDTFLVYPGPRLSVRWENLRDSIENFEKIRVLRESGAFTPELEKALSAIDYTSEAANGNEAYFASRVKAVTDAISAASAR